MWGLEFKVWAEPISLEGRQFWPNVGCSKTVVKKMACVARILVFGPLHPAGTLNVAHVPIQRTLETHLLSKECVFVLLDISA